MIPTVIALGDLKDDSARSDFTRRFAECARDLREPEFAPFAPSVQYTTLVLGLMRALPHELFLVMDKAEGSVAGRAAVFALAAMPGVAGIGLFECAAGAARDARSGALIDACCDWAVHHDRGEIFAPVDLNSWFSYRFLMPPATGESLGRLYSWEPVQPLDYPAAFLRRGFAEGERYGTLIGEFGGAARAAIAAMRSPAIEQARADGYVFEQLVDAAALPALLREAHPVCVEAFAGTLLFEPIDANLFVAILLGGASRKDCTLTHCVRDRSGRMVGFALAFVDGDAAVVKSAAVATHARGRRLSSALTQLAIKAGAERGLTTFISALIRSGNASELLVHPYITHAAKVVTHEYALLQRASRPS